jgi:hypothetical protein
MTTARSRSGQGEHGIGQVRPPLPVDQDVVGGAVGAGQQVAGLAVGHDRLVVEHRGPVDVVDQLVHGLGVGAQLGGQLGLGRGPAEPPGQLLARLLEPPGPRADRAAGPVRVAQLVEQGAADPGGGVALEARPPVGVPAPGRLGQAEHGRRREVVAVDVGRQPAGQLAHRLAGQVEMVTDQLVERSGVIAEVSTTLRGCLITRLDG